MQGSVTLTGLEKQKLEHLAEKKHCSKRETKKGLIKTIGLLHFLKNNFYFKIFWYSFLLLSISLLFATSGL
ncbi:hypothetical protein GCM10022258_25740 [Aquimarina gracilis]